LLSSGKILISGGNAQGSSPAELYNSGIGLPTAIVLKNLNKLPNGAFQFSFTNAPSVSFSVFATDNLSLPLSNWPMRCGIVEISPGQYVFTDEQMTNSPHRFYRVQAD